MKFQDIFSFKKRLEGSFPDNLINLYFIIAEDEFERNRIVDNVLCYLPHSSSFSVNKLLKEKISIGEVIQRLNSFSLFGEEEITILNDVDLFNKKEIQLLITYLKENPILGFLILTAKSKKNSLTLLAEADKKGIVLDLSSEKIWDREKRLKNLIIERCAQSKKTITERAKELMVAKVGCDMAAMENEIGKVILYKGEENVISEEDVLKVCSDLNKKSIWQIADSIIWGEDPFGCDIEGNFKVDSSFFNFLVVALRYNLQEGLKLTKSFQSSNRSFKRAKRAKILGSGFFKKCLNHLFEIEFLSRNGNSQFLALLDLFRAKLKGELDYGTYTPTKSFR
jgi:hypothetical protein